MLQFYSNYYTQSSLFHGSIHKIMGTRLDIVATGCNKDTVESVWYNIIAELERLDKMLNRYHADSEIANINLKAAIDPVNVSPETFDILKSCKDYYKRTIGLFDITLKNYSLVVLNETDYSVFLKSDDLSLDLGGFGKGYALEKVKLMLLDADIDNALVNFGNSSIIGLGHHPQGDCWSVSIDNPFQSGHIPDKIELRNNAMSTSGNSLAHTKHVIDPHTGVYNEEKKLVCAVTANAVDAEVLTTSLLIADEMQKKEITSNFIIDKLIIFDNL